MQEDFRYQPSCCCFSHGCVVVVVVVVVVYLDLDVSRQGFSVSPGYPGTHSVDQDVLKLRNLPAPTIQNARLQVGANMDWPSTSLLNFAPHPGA